EEAIDAVAVVVIILGGVDTALRGDGVGAAGGILEAEALDVIAELGEGGCAGSACEAGADHDDGVLALIGRIDQLEAETMAIPSRFNRASGAFGIEWHVGSSECHEAGQDGDGNGAVPDADEQRDNGRSLFQNGRIARVVESQGLEEAPQAMVEVHAEQDHGEDVEAGDPGILEAEHDVAVDVGLIGGDLSPGQSGYGADGEMQNVENDKRGDDGSAPHHGAGGVGSGGLVLFGVGDGTGGAVQVPELDGGRDVHNDGGQQEGADDPQRNQVGGVVQKRGVMIDLLRI